MKSLTVLVDTREKKNKHITDFFDKRGLPYIHRALERGDYSFMIPQNEALNIPRDVYFDHDVVIERKASLEELSGNFTKGRDRFEKEMSLAPTTKVLLIENANYHDIVSGNYNTQYNKSSFIGTLHSFWFKYNMPVFFMPDSRYSPIFIREYFEYYIKNYLR